MSDGLTDANKDIERAKKLYTKEEIKTVVNKVLKEYYARAEDNKDDGWVYYTWVKAAMTLIDYIKNDLFNEEVFILSVKRGEDNWKINTRKKN